jgi:hypothetical protein
MRSAWPVSSSCAASEFRGDDLYQFDLVELVLADHAARVATVGAGFGAKTRRMADELERQRVGGEDLATHDVGDRHFGGRNQVQRLGVGAQNLEQILLEFRQLPGAEQAGGVDQVRRIDLG